VDSELDRQTASRRAAAVNKDWVVCFLAAVGKRETQALVQALANSGDADAESRSLFIREVVRDLALDVSFSNGVLCEAAVFFLDGVDTVRETGDAVAFIEGLGYFGAHADDGSHVVTANGATFALLGESGDVDVFPIEMVFSHTHGWGALALSVLLTSR
jgi:hypothetical protein